MAGNSWGRNFWSTFCSDREPCSKTNIWGRLAPVQGLNNRGTGVTWCRLPLKVPGAGACVIRQSKGEG